MGAVWSSCPSEFGVPAVLERFVQVSASAETRRRREKERGEWGADFVLYQIEPKVLITADFYRCKLLLSFRELRNPS